MAVILFSDNTEPVRISESMLNGNTSRPYLTLYQAGLPGWRRGWSELVEASGGYVARTGTDSFPEIETILHDLDQYYLLGYIPDEKTLDIPTQRFQTTAGPRELFRIESHSVKVKTNLRDIKVRTKASFRNAALRPGLDPVLVPNAGTSGPVLTSSPFIPGDLAMNAEAIPYLSSKQESLIRVLLNVKGKDLKFLPEPGKDFSTASVVVIGQLSFNSMMVQAYRGNHLFTAHTKESGKPEDKVYSTSFDIPAPEPGLYALRTTIYEGWEGLVGNSAILVEMPDFTKSDLAASGITTYALSKDPETPVLPQSISRRIHRSDPFGCSLSVYNARRDESSGSAQIESQLRLYRDGKLVQASEVVPVPDQGRDSISKGIAVNFGVSPSPDLTAGNYLLEVLVIDRLAGKKNNTTAQTVAIELLE